MTPNTTLKEKSEEKILKVKKMVEELELQLALGKADLLDEVENQKKNLNNFINSIKEELYKPENKENTDKLQAIFEELQVQLALGKAETRDAIAEQKENLFKSIKKLEDFFSKDTDQIFSGFANDFNFSHEKLSYLMDMAKLQFVLGKAEFKDEFQEKRSEFLQNLNEFKSGIEDNLESAEETFMVLKTGFKNVISGFLSGLKNKGG